MMKETSVIAVLGARRAAVFLAGLAWLALCGVSAAVAIFKAAGACMAMTLMALGPFQPPDDSGAFYLIAALMVAGFGWLAWFSWARFEAAMAALAVPLDEDVAKAVNVIASVSTSSTNFMASVRKAIDEQKSESPGSES